MSEEAKGSIPPGCVISDKENNKWIIQSCIGVTGKTESYLGAPHNVEGTKDSAAVLIKIEPIQNERRSTEMQFYFENAIPEQIENWIKIKHIQDFGLSIPRLLGSGSHEYNSKIYRFIVTKKYDTNLWTLFVKNGKQFPAHTVYKVAIQILRVLEYIHNKGYLHANIEGKNLFLDLATQSSLLEERCVYLTNFYSASRKGDRGDSNKLLNSPVEYLSRDSHTGEPTMRGDLEMLLYNMIRWLGHSLPWGSHLKDSSKVYQLKEDAFKNIFSKEYFVTSQEPVPITKFAKLLASMNRRDKPEYKEIRDIFVKELKNLYHAPNGRLQWRVDNIVHKSDQELSEQHRKDECIPGIHVSIKVLGGIISENCRNLSEVDLQSTEPGSLLDIIHRLTTIRKIEEQKIKKLQRAWENDGAKLRTKVWELWKRKGISIDSALLQKNVKTKEDTPATSEAANTNVLSYSSAGTSTAQSHLSSTRQNETPLIDSPSTLSPEGNGINRHLSLQAKTVKQTKSTRRKRKYGNKAPWDKKRKRNRTSRKTNLADETSDDENEMNRQRSLSPSMFRSASSDTTGFGSPSCRALSGARSAAIFQSNSDYSPFSPASSSGFGSHTSDRDGIFIDDSSRLTNIALSRDKWQSMYIELDAWLTLKSQNLEAFGPISSESETVDSQVEQLRLLRDDFSKQQPQKDQLVKTLREQPTSSQDSQKFNQIEQRWQQQFSRLEGRGQSLIDARLGQLHNTLENISVKLNGLTLDRGPREQLQLKVENLEDQLGSQRTLLADVKTMCGKLCKIFNNSALSINVPAKIQTIEEFYRNLHQKIESRKFDFKKNFSNRDQFEDSCKEVHLWLDDKLGDMSEKVLVSTDRVPEQFEQHETFHQDVMSMETEVMELLKKGREDLAMSPNVDGPTTQQRYLDSIQAKWDRLKKCSLETLNKLKTCFNLGEDYHHGQVQISPWLKKIEDKLDSLKRVLWKHEDDFEKQLNELSVMKNEVSEKFDELKQIINIGDTFVRSCDIDKDDKVKNEVTALKVRGDKLNKSILERMQSLKNTSGEFADINRELCSLKTELNQYEDELASQNVLQGSALDPKVHDRIKELMDKTVSLYKPLEIVHQQAEKLTPEAHERGIDVSHLLKEVLTVQLHIPKLGSKLVAASKYGGIIDHNFVSVKKEQEGQVEIIDLSSDEDELDLGCDSNGLSAGQHIESTSFQNSNLEQCAQPRENETLTNDEQILKAAESKIDIKEEPVEKVNDAGSSFHPNPSMSMPMHSGTGVNPGTSFVRENDDISLSPKSFLGKCQIAATISQNTMEEQLKERRKSREEQLMNVSRDDNACRQTTLECDKVRLELEKNTSEN